MRNTLIFILLLVSVFSFSACSKSKTEEKEKINVKLSQAADIGDYKTAKEMIDKGADVNTRRGGGIVLKAKYSKRGTALMLAAAGGHFDIVKLLLENGAKVNAETSTGWTALMLASRNGRHDTVEILIERGANVNAKDRQGRTALSHALGWEHKRVIQLLKSAGALDQ